MGGRCIALLLAVVAPMACAPSLPAVDGGPAPEADAAVIDPADAGRTDGGVDDAGAPDGGRIDAVRIDGGPVDAGVSDGGNIDAGTGVDAGAGTDAGGSFDGGALDGGAMDGGAMDSGAMDGGGFDGGADAGRDGGAPEWEMGVALPGARYDGAAAVLGGELWLIGGLTGAQQPTASVAIFNPLTSEWRSGPAVPTAMHHAHVAVVDERIYVVGFLREGSFIADGRGYSIAAGETQWTQQATLPTGRERGAGAVGVVGGEVIVAGGYRAGAVDQVDAYDPQANSWRTLPSLPAVVEHGAGAVVNGRFFVVGGRAPGQDDGLATVLERVPDAGWVERAPLPQRRSSVAVAVHDGQVWIIGGYGAPIATELWARVDVYDPSADTWRAGPDLPGGLQGASGASLDDAIHVLGGTVYRWFSVVDTHLVLTP